MAVNTIVTLAVFSILLGVAYGYYGQGGIVGPNIFQVIDKDAELTSNCPKLWADASHMNLGCLLFNATTPMSWHAAQDLCKESSSHLVEIFTPEQQEFMVMKAFEAHGITGMEREWWIGLTDANSEGRWYWIDSLKEAEFIPWGVWQPDGGKEANFGSMFAGFDYRWTDETSAFEYRGGAYPICQL